MRGPREGGGEGGDEMRREVKEGGEGRSWRGRRTGNGRNGGIAELVPVHCLL